MIIRFIYQLLLNSTIIFTLKNVPDARKDKGLHRSILF